MAPKRILIVDDEEDIRDIVQLSLEMEAGWDVLTASSGTEGIARAEVEQPDAILLDIMMPDMDGIATFQQLQANPIVKNIPVILLTAKIRAVDERQFETLGIAAAIIKPFDPIDLAEQIATALNWPI